MYQKKTRGAKPWIIMACVIAAFIWLLYALGDVLTPFIVAAVLAYVLNPLVEWLQLKRIRRGLYDYYGAGFADIAVVSTDYRAYVVEPV